MTCQQQCDRPAFFPKIGPQEVPLCIVCYAQLSQALQAENDQHIRTINFAMDMADVQLGLPSSGPRFRPRAAPNHIGVNMMQNLSINNSAIGVLNTGSIETIGTATAHLEAQGHQDLARGIQALTRAISDAADLNDAHKKEAVEILSAVAQEASADKNKQRPGLARHMATSLGEILRTSAAVSALWRQWWPTIERMLAG